MGNPHGANLRRCEARLFRAIVKPLILRCGPRTVKGKQDDRQSSLDGRRTRAGWKGNPNHTRLELVIDLTLRLSLINAYDAATDVAQ
jgi:hypothetical protein